MDPSLESIQLLKQEINQTQEDEHDLAKWKLIVTAALGAAALGANPLSHATPSESQLWLLLLIPFVCAYIDLYDYQYRLRVLLIAQFIREQGQDSILTRYEAACDRLRQGNSGFFSLGNAASLGSSIGLSALGPVLYLAQPNDHHPAARALESLHDFAFLIWLLGVALVLTLYLVFRRKSSKTPLPAEPDPSSGPFSLTHHELSKLQHG